MSIGGVVTNNLPRSKTKAVDRMENGSLQYTKSKTTLLGDNSKRSTKPSPTYLNNRQAWPGLGKIALASIRNTVYKTRVTPPS